MNIVATRGLGDAGDAVIGDRLDRIKDRALSVLDTLADLNAIADVMLAAGEDEPDDALAW